MDASIASTKLAVVSSLKQWGVDQVSVQFGFYVAWLTERALTWVVQSKVQSLTLQQIGPETIDEQDQNEPGQSHNGYIDKDYIYCTFRVPVVP